MMARQRLHVVLQRDTMQCGVASLAMVCGWYGRRFSLAEMEQHCHPTRQGVSLKGIMDGARAVGLDSKAGKCAVDDLSLSDGPCILHWRQEHFVVLYRVRKGRWFYIADPAGGKARLSRQELEQNWVSTSVGDKPAGIALFFEPTGAFYSYRMQTEKPPHPARFLLGSCAATAAISSISPSGCCWPPPCSSCSRLPAPFHPAARRGHELPRRGQREAHHRRPASAAAGPHGRDRGTPAEHGPRRRQHHRPGRRPRRGAGQPLRPHRPPRPLLPPGPQPAELVES